MTSFFNFAFQARYIINHEGKIFIFNISIYVFNEHYWIFAKYLLET